MKLNKLQIFTLVFMLLVGHSVAQASEFSLKLGVGSGSEEMTSIHLGKRKEDSGNEFSALQLTLSTRNMTQHSMTEYHLDPVEGELDSWVVSDIVESRLGSEGAVGNTIGITKEEGAYFGAKNQFYTSAQFGIGILEISADEGNQSGVEANFGFNLGMILRAGSRLRFDAGIGCGLVQVLDSIENYDDKVEHCKLSVNTLFK